MVGSGSILGNAVRRVEDPGILRGETRYLDDVPVEGVAHLVFVRSTIAHARLESVDTSEAAAMPGVLAAHAAADLGLAPLQAFVMIPPAMSRPPLAEGVVRFVGDCVAAVVAETRAQAVDAAELVVVDYDPLPALVDPEAALADDAPVLFPEHGSNVAVAFDFGQDPSVLEGADVVVSARIANQRLAPVPMEANGIVVEPRPDGGLTVWVTTQNAFAVRDPLAGALGLEPRQVRVIAPAVGGGSGPRWSATPSTSSPPRRPGGSDAP
ncbi:MAG: molybdopterin-dependent oxidoreductase [Acidimicrobiia bacterium]|nr:molybdopterin-dependent oxidoreductase [Acidimicrobiia bacterium]